MQNPIKVGVAGYGMAAQVMHLPFLTTSPFYSVVNILERHHDHSPGKYPGVTVVRSIGELVADPGTDLIVITSPNETHFPYAKKALLAGKHVVVEKPFTVTTEEAAELIVISRKAGRVLSVYQNRRYVNHFLTIQKILAEELLGKPVGFEAHYDRYRPGPKPNAWREEDRPGAGIFYDLGAHLLDQALCLFGPPQTITADLRLQRSHAKATDYFDCWLDYGLLKVSLTGGMLVREAGPRYIIHGTQGSYIKYDDDPQEALLKEGILPTIPHWGEEAPDRWGLLHTDIGGKTVRELYPSLPGNYGLYYQHLAETLLEGAPLRVRPEQSYNTIRLIELATASSRGKETLECTGLME
ncbi:MAG TPA: Gfo/Idh/MocA family oxidoreductase [Puia sp.]|nr:Gfo/Idh/MocA family oxidoreductase [Puia sp.]